MLKTLNNKLRRIVGRAGMVICMVLMAIFAVVVLALHSGFKAMQWMSED